jgi:thioredoxin reductase
MHSRLHDRRTGTRGKQMPQFVDVAIVGAGPYGLSLATHLRTRGIEFRIFGSPLYRWREQMPDGMLLKSEGFASNLYDPAGQFTLENFCAVKGLPYADVGKPVARSVFAAYGIDFQQRLVPNLEDKAVATIDQARDAFTLRLVDGEMMTARRVVIATGMSYFQHVPTNLAHLPQELLTHSQDHRDLSQFRGQDVTVIGGGASALDVAAELREVGADVHVVARRPAIVFNPYAEKDRPLWRRLRYPVSGIGFGLRSWIYTEAPIAFHHLPEVARQHIVRTYLGPAGGYYVRDKIVDRVPLALGSAVAHATTCRDGITLHILNKDGRAQTLTTNHVIAATGYRVDLQRLTFLSDATRAQIRSAGGSPILSTNFETSVPGLHFVGLGQ